jgi:hypothetical protein
MPQTVPGPMAFFSCEVVPNPSGVLRYKVIFKRRGSVLGEWPVATIAEGEAQAPKRFAMSETLFLRRSESRERRTVDHGMRVYSSVAGGVRTRIASCFPDPRSQPSQRREPAESQNLAAARSAPSP